MGEIERKGLGGLWEFVRNGILFYKSHFRILFLIALISMIPTIIRMAFNVLRAIGFGSQSFFLIDLFYYLGILITIILLYYSAKIKIAQLRFVHSHDGMAFCRFKNAYKMKSGTVWLYVLIGFLASIILFLITMIITAVIRILVGLGAEISLTPMAVWEAYSGWFSVATNIVFALAAGIYLVPLAIEGHKRKYFRSIIRRIKVKPLISLGLLAVMVVIYIINLGFGRLLNVIWRGIGSYTGISIFAGLFDTLLAPIILVLSVSWYRLTSDPSEGQVFEITEDGDRCEESGTG
ncbi:MAG: hypothetical protein R3232_12820, partial [Clostridia bacterium]|nr:hypothetical protein [Clostridia bacterium]